MQGSFRNHNRKRLIGELLDAQVLTADHLLTTDIGSNEEDKIRNLVILLHNHYCIRLKNIARASPAFNIVNTTINGMNDGKLYKNDVINQALQKLRVDLVQDVTYGEIPIWFSDQTKKLYLVDANVLSFMGIRVMALIDARSSQDILNMVKDTSTKIVNEADAVPDSSEYKFIKWFRSIEERNRVHAFLRLLLAVGNMFPKHMSFRKVMTDNDLPEMLREGRVPSNVVDAINKIVEQEHPLEPRDRPPGHDEDEEYAIAVKGNAVNTNLSVVWSPQLKDGIDNYDQEQFAGILWKVIENYVGEFTKKYWAEGNLNRGTLDQQKRDLGNSITSIRKELKDIWYGTFQWSITPEVQGVEYEILYRLTRSGGDRNCAIAKEAAEEGDAIIRFMRHDKRIMPAFAAAVGKRLLTERIISRGRTSIVEHHRSVKWSETTFATLQQLNPIMAYKAFRDSNDRQGGGADRRPRGVYPMLVDAI